MGGGKGGAGDMVLESRHLMGLFLLMVVVSAVVFTLGYLMGRSQYETQARTATATSAGASRAGEAEPAPAKPGTPAAKDSPATSVPAPSDWDFYRAGEANKPVTPLETTGKPAGGAPHPAKQSPPRAAAAKSKLLMDVPLVPRGAIVLQVAALTREGDALALAEALQKKKFPAFVLTPGADVYYRVQVGPYADAQSAVIARRGLENEGFKAIIKR